MAYFTTERQDAEIIGMEEGVNNFKYILNAMEQRFYNTYALSILRPGFTQNICF